MNDKERTTKREKGQSAVVVALMIIIVMAFMGLTIDVGRLYLTRQQLQTYTDAATLAGARELPFGPESDFTKEGMVKEATHKALMTYARNVGADLDLIPPAESLTFSPAWDPEGENMQYTLDLPVMVGDEEETDHVVVTVYYSDTMTVERGLAKERTMFVEASRDVPMIFGGLLGPSEARASRPAAAFRGVFEVQWRYYSQADVHATPNYWVDRDNIEKVYTASRDGFIYALDAWGDDETNTTWAYWKYKVLAGGNGERTLCFPYQPKGACEPSIGGDINRSYAIISSPKPVARVEAPDYCEATDGCMGFTVLSAIDNGDGTTTLVFKVCSNCTHALSNVAFSLPGMPALWPNDGGVYNGSHNNYNVENPTSNPFYSIKYETIGEGIKDGQCDTFRFTLPTEDAEYPVQVRAKASTNTYDASFDAGCGYYPIEDMGQDLLLFTSYPLSDDSNRGYLYALDSQTGDKVWSRYVGQRKYHAGAYGYTYIDSDPVVSPDGSIVYVGSRDGRLYAFYVADGSDVWPDCNPGGPSDSCYELVGGTVSSPVVDPTDGTIYIGTSKRKDGSGTGSPWDRGVVQAINPDGTLKWTWAPPRSGNGFDSSPRLWPENNPTTLYIGNQDKRLYSLNISGSTPSLRWEYYPPDEIDPCQPGKSCDPRSPISATPLVVEEDGSVYVYFATEYGGGFKIRDDGGGTTLMWSTWLGLDINTQSEPPGGGGTFEGQLIERRALHISPDIAEDFVYFGVATIWNRECAFQALRKDTGQIFQSFVMENDTHSTLRVAPNNWLYYASCDNFTYGVDTNPEALDSRLVK
jgi:Flp pilus assembly protein TadG